MGNRYFIATVKDGTKNRFNASNGWSERELAQIMQQHNMTEVSRYKIGPIINVLVKIEK